MPSAMRGKRALLSICNHLPRVESMSQGSTLSTRAACRVALSCGQGARVRQDLIIASAKHLRQIQLRLHVNRQGIGVNAHLSGFTDGLPHVGNAVAAFIAVVIGGFAVADQQQQFLGGFLLLEKMEIPWRMAGPIRV